MRQNIAIYTLICLFFIGFSNNGVAQLNADFNANTNSGCSPLTVNFSDQSIGSATSYFWDFGNGNTSTSQNPSAIFITPGTYDIKLVVRDGAGNSDSVTRQKFIQVFNGPTSGASTSKRTACVGQSINFNDNSTKGDGNITSWKWDFGDGNIDNSQNPSHSYASAGTYSIRLITKDANGCEHSVTLNNHIVVNAAPSSDFSISAPFGCKAPHQTSFTATNTAGTTYNWNFGDGKGGTGKNPSHSYNSLGSYDVTLEVIDNLGCKSQTTKKVIIADLVPSIFTSSKIVCIDQYINFVGSCSPPLLNAIYDWDLGDSRKVRGSAFSHKYSSEGTYTITLKVSAGSCSGTKVFNDLIKVRKPPEINLTVSDTVLCDRSKYITFSDQSSNIKKREWNFSNGEKSLFQSPRIQFKTGGTYNYTIDVEDNYGCENSKNGSVKISEIHARFTTDEYTSDSIFSYTIYRNRPIYGKCVPYDLKLKENIYSIFKVDSMYWDLGNSTTSQASEVIPHYTEIDTIYHGILWAKDIYGCKDSIDYYVRLGDSTYPNFTPDKWEVCNGDTVQFTNLSYDSANITKYKWSFGKNEYHPKHVFNQKPDTIDITLETFHHNCKNDTSIYGLKIRGPYGKIQTSYNSCSTDSILLKANAVEYDSLVWMDALGQFITNDTSILIQPYNGAQYFLKTWNDNGCSYLDSISIVLKDIVKVEMEWPSIEDCAPSNALFSYTPTTPSTYQWIFSNIDTFRTNEVDYTFEKAGNHNVRLQVTAENGCTGAVSKSYNVPGVLVSGSVKSLDTCLPFNVILTDSLYNPNSSLSYYWVINGEDTVHHNAVQTNYTLTTTTPSKKVSIELFGTDNIECHSSQYFEVFASGPNATLAHYPIFFCDSIESTINLLNKSKDITFISWKYQGNEISSMSNLVYKFPYDKEHEVSVKLVDSKGCQAIYRKNIYKEKSLQANFFSDTTGSFCPPLEVYFNDSSISHRPIIKYEWDFGDGTGSFLKNPGKLYLVPGRYTVSLTITDDNGCISKKVAPDFILVNGPTGSYSFTPNKGCSPLEVTFNSQSNNASIIKWDLGDGIVLNGADQKLSYDRIGQYIPLLILEDIYGCSYTMPPIDTIHVHGYPNSKFNTWNNCLNDTVKFVNQTQNTNGKISHSYWDFGNGDTSSMFTPYYKYTTGKNHLVNLISTNEHGCKDTASKKIKLFDPKAEFYLIKERYCIGEPLEIINTSSSDTTIQSYFWNFASLGNFTNKTPNPPLNKVGNFNFFLSIIDDAGCKDTTNLGFSIGIGDTIAPTPPLLQRVSVLNDNSIDITFENDPISDFYRLELLREISPGVYNKVGESLTQEDSIIFDNSISTLHESHCFILNKENFCNKKTEQIKLIKHCTVEATAKGKLNAIDIDWNPYIGWNEVDSYYVYRQERLIPDSFTMIGKVDGNTFLYTDTTIYCRDELFYKILAKQKVNALPHWSWSDSTAAKPIYENTVPPNEIWRTTVVDDEYTNLEWLPITTNKFPIAYYKIQIQEGDKGFKELEEKFDPSQISFENMKTKVDDFNYHYQMYAVDVCDDKSALSIPAKTVLLNVSMNQEFRPELEWTTYQGWNEGVEEYIIEMEDEFGGFTEIGRAQPTDTTFIDEVSPFNCIENYCYRITAIRNQPDKQDSSFSVISHSNIDCAPVVSKIFVPNAFTINADGLNDDFKVKGIYIKRYNIKIFNRWGEKVYESDSFKENWDGTFGGQRASQGVFVYLIEAQGVDNKLYHLSGDVTLLR